MSNLPKILAVSTTNSSMSRLTLVFTVCSAVIAGIHFTVANGEGLPEDQLENPLEELDEASDRSAASANAQAHALGQGLVRPRPVPVPYPPSKPMPLPSVSMAGLCYSCTGCPTPNNQSLVACPDSYDSTKQHKCVVYTEKYKYMKEPWYIRGCVSERGTCEEIKKAHQNQELVKLLSCHQCEGNACNLNNGAGNPLPDLFIAFVAVVVTPILTQISLSKI